MALTGRTALLALIGVVPVALAPGLVSILGWLLVVVAAVAVDLLLAGSPLRVAVNREAVPSVRLGEAVEAPVVLVNHGRRRVRGVARDAWQPSAGAGVTRHAVDLPAGRAAPGRDAAPPAAAG